MEKSTNEIVSPTKNYRFSKCLSNTTNICSRNSKLAFIFALCTSHPKIYEIYNIFILLFCLSRQLRGRARPRNSRAINRLWIFQIRLIHIKEFQRYFQYILILHLFNLDNPHLFGEWGSNLNDFFINFLMFLNLHVAQRSILILFRQIQQLLKLNQIGNFQILYVI